MVIKYTYPIKHESIVFREESDDWAFLFDPDTGSTLILNPTSVLIWEKMDGTHTCADILKCLDDCCEDVPDEAEEHIKKVIRDLVSQGFAEFKRS